MQSSAEKFAFVSWGSGFPFFFFFVLFGVVLLAFLWPLE